MSVIDNIYDSIIRLTIPYTHETEEYCVNEVIFKIIMLSTLFY